MSDAAGALSSKETLTTVVNHSAKIAPRKWTHDEIEQLQHLRTVDGLSFEEIGERLGRSAGSVNGKATVLGLKLPETWRCGRNRHVGRKHLAELRHHWAIGTVPEKAAQIIGFSEATAVRFYRAFSREASVQDATVSTGTYIGHKEMMAIVAPICGVPASAIPGPTRLKPNLCARMAVARALHDRGLSLSRISGFIGRNDSSTVRNLLDKFDGYCRDYPETAKAYQAIKNAEARAAERLAA